MQLPDALEPRDDPRPEALELLLDLISDGSGLVRAVASGRIRGAGVPAYKRLELRYVDLRSGRQLQVTEYDDRQAHVRNIPAGQVRETVAALLSAPYGSWHVETTAETVRLRYTKKGRVLLHREDAAREQDTAHDRAKERLLDPGAEFLRVLGISDHHGKVKPSRMSKYRQVEEFCRILAAGVDDAVAGGRLRPGQVLRVVDLGCGNAYLTMAAYHLLTERGYDVRMTGVDRDPKARARNTARVAELGWEDHVRFLDATIDSAEVEERPDRSAKRGGSGGSSPQVDIALALHACDTATDDALARAVGWQAPLVLAAPCCHHDLQKQLKAADPPSPYALMTRYGIVRERFADVLTDALRASVLRQVGYRVEVMQFVDSEHTPRNLLLRAARTGAPADEAVRAEYASLTEAWQVTPKLATLVLDTVS